MIAKLGRRHFSGLIAGFLLAGGPIGVALAVEVDVDGLPVPRFVSTRSAPLNVRVGPGLKYDLAWIYNMAGMPVEITAEFDIWRKIRDYDGSEGWVQENLLTGNRTGLVSPWKKGPDLPLLASAREDATPRAYLPSGFKVNIRRCDGKWCQVDASSQDTTGRHATYTGYLKQSDLWGAYQGEVF